MELKKIIAFDLDGTLTESKQPMTAEMASLVDALCLKYKVAIISGGSFPRFKEQFVHQLKNTENLILLPTSGSCRYEFDKEWKQTFSHPFTIEVKNKVIEEFKKIISDKSFDIPEKHFGPYVEDRGNQITISALGQDAPLEIKSSWDPHSIKRLKIREDLEKMIPEIDAHIGGMTSVDVLPKGFDKAVGLKLLLESENLTMKDMLFVGDSVFEGGNDYSPKLAGIETVGVKGPEETAGVIRSLV